MRALLLLVVVVLVAHFTGFLRPVEETFAPSIADKSSDWLGDVLRDGAAKAATKVIQAQLDGNPEQKAAATAVCKALDTDLPDNVDASQLKKAAEKELSKSNRADPEVIDAVDGIVSKVSKVKNLTPILRDACPKVTG